MLYFILESEATIDKDWVVKFTHVYREENRVAKYFPNLDLKMNLGYHRLMQPLHKVVGLMLEYIKGVCLPHVVRM